MHYYELEFAFLSVRCDQSDRLILIANYHHFLLVRNICPRYFHEEMSLQPICSSYFKPASMCSVASIILNSIPEPCIIHYFIIYTFCLSFYFFLTKRK